MTRQVALKYVQLRLNPKDEQALQAAADASGRTLPGEVLHRMTTTLEAEKRVRDLEALLPERDREITRLNGVIEGLSRAMAYLTTGRED